MPLFSKGQPPMRGKSSKVDEKAARLEAIDRLAAGKDKPKVQISIKVKPDSPKEEFIRLGKKKPVVEDDEEDMDLEDEELSDDELDAEAEDGLCPTCSMPTDMCECDEGTCADCDLPYSECECGAEDDYEGEEEDFMAGKKKKGGKGC